MKYILTLLLLIGSFALQARSSEPPKSWTPDPLEDSIKKYDKAGKYGQALVFAEQWLVKTKKNPGKDSLDFAAVLNLQGDLLSKENKPKEARQNLFRSFEIRKRALGTDHPDVASSLNNLGGLFLEERDYAKAESFLMQALKINKKILGQEHPAVGSSLYSLGVLFIKLGDHTKAEPFILQALEIRKKVLGPEHSDVASSIFSLGILLLKKGDYTKAESLFRQALEIRKKSLGPDHHNVAKSFNSLGVLYLEMGEYAKAEPFLLQALEINKKVLSPEHAEVAVLLNNIGGLYVKMGFFSRAEPFFLQALEIRKKLPGQEQSDNADVLSNLGALYGELGDYDLGETYLLQALEIQKKVLGNQHPDIALLYNNLGTIFFDKGIYPKVEAYFNQAFEIRKAILDSNHPDLAQSHLNIGSLLNKLGERSKAESHLLLAIEIYKKALGPEHPDVAIAYDALGGLYEGAKAESCYLKALEIRKKVLGAEHPAVAKSYLQLGDLNDEMNNYSAAEKFKLKGIEIEKNNLGSEHPEVARSLQSLGYSSWLKRDYEKAESCFLEAMGILKNKLGPEHPTVAFSYFQLGRFYSKKSKLGEQNFHEYSKLSKKLIQNYFPAMSENGKEAYLKKGMEERQYLQSIWSEEGMSIPTMRGELYNHQLFYKGLLLNTSARWKQRIKTSGDLKLIRRYDEWENLQNKISRLLSSTDSTERAGLDSLVDKAEKLEKELSQRSENFARSEERKVRTWQEVQQALKPGEAAIEMVRFRHFGIAKIVTDTSDPKKPTYRVKGLTDTVQYAALILTKTSIQPELVILPNGNDLEGKWHKYYRNSVRLQQKDAESYKQYWQPIARKLKGIKKVWFSADGVYHKLNLGTLQNPATGKYLMDELEIALLGSTKDLLKKYPEDSENRLACLVGNPEFQPGQTAVTGKSRSGPELSYYFKPDPSLEVAALPGTQQEIDGVAGILSKQGWEVQEYAGADASEEKVKDSYKPRVMLLSTHGFFRSDTTPGSNPLLRSGLLLSGAAKTLREGRSGEGEDGILTAYEAMNLNLDNTELVVLSACETGLGEIKNGEGVYGLQRAFQVAGARNLIMSLWKVDDAVTKDLMLAFFRNWLGESRGESQFAPKGPDDLRNAFRKAQLEIRRKNPEPHYWGGFVLLGK